MVLWQKWTNGIQWRHNFTNETCRGTNQRFLCEVLKAPSWVAVASHSKEAVVGPYLCDRPMEFQSQRLVSSCFLDKEQLNSLKRPKDFPIIQLVHQDDGHWWALNHTNSIKQHTSTKVGCERLNHLNPSFRCAQIFLPFLTLLRPCRVKKLVAWLQSLYKRKSRATSRFIF